MKKYLCAFLVFVIMMTVPVFTLAESSSLVTKIDKIIKYKGLNTLSDKIIEGSLKTAGFSDDKRENAQIVIENNTKSKYIKIVEKNGNFIEENIITPYIKNDKNQIISVFDLYSSEQLYSMLSYHSHFVETEVPLDYLIDYITLTYVALYYQYDVGTGAHYYIPFKVKTKYNTTNSNVNVIYMSTEFIVRGPYYDFPSCLDDYNYADPYLLGSDYTYIANAISWYPDNNTYYEAAEYLPSNYALSMYSPDAGSPPYDYVPFGRLYGCGYFQVGNNTPQYFALCVTIVVVGHERNYPKKEELMEDDNGLPTKSQRDSNPNDVAAGKQVNQSD